jgi:hypothetical protein
MKFIITGNHQVLSREEIRSMFMASATVLEYHNKNTADDINSITIKILPESKMRPLSVGKNRGEKSGGTAWRNNRLIHLNDVGDFDNVLTKVLHEMIHIYIEESPEKTTCILTNRLKPWVVGIYEVLINGVYQRAGYIAHAKISYKPKGADEYENCQWDKTGITNNIGEKYRNKKKANSTSVM